LATLENSSTSKRPMGLSTRHISAKGLFFVGHVAQAKGHGHHIKAGVRKGQKLGITDQGGQGHALVEQSVAAFAQHGFVDVGVHHSAGFSHFGGKSQAKSPVPPAMSSTDWPGRTLATSTV
jgi:hypothetical protein